MMPNGEMKNFEEKYQGTLFCIYGMISASPRIDTGGLRLS